jgi:hypothetical protein
LFVAARQGRRAFQYADALFDWCVIDVFSATIPDFPFRPQLHVNYAETVLPMRDGLPKLPGHPELLSIA